MARPGGGLLVALGIGKKKPESGPPSYKSDPMDPGEATETQEPDADTDDQAGGGMISPEEVDYSDNDLCETCANMGQDGNCIKYNFPVDKTGHCEAGYEPKGGEMGMPGMPAAMGAPAGMQQ